MLKRSLEKQVLQSMDTLSVSHKLANFLFVYCNTPHTITGETPVSLFLKWNPRTRLSLLYPNVAETVERQQSNLTNKNTMMEQNKNYKNSRNMMQCKLKSFMEELGNGKKALWLDRVGARKGLVTFH